MILSHTFKQFPAILTILATLLATMLPLHAQEVPAASELESLVKAVSWPAAEDADVLDQPPAATTRELRMPYASGSKFIPSMPHGRYMLVTPGDASKGMGSIYDLHRRVLYRKMPTINVNGMVVLSPEGSRLAAETTDDGVHKIVIASIIPPRPMATITLANSNKIQWMAFADDKTLLVMVDSLDSKAELIAYDTVTTQKLWQLQNVQDLKSQRWAMTPNGRYLALVYQTSNLTQTSVALLDTHTGQRAGEIEVAYHGQVNVRLNGIAFSPTGAWMGMYFQPDQSDGPEPYVLLVDAKTGKAMDRMNVGELPSDLKHRHGSENELAFIDETILLVKDELVLLRGFAHAVDVLPGSREEKQLAFRTTGRSDVLRLMKGDRGETYLSLQGVDPVALAEVGKQRAVALQEERAKQQASAQEQKDLLATKYATQQAERHRKAEQYKVAQADRAAKAAAAEALANAPRPRQVMSDEPVIGKFTLAWQRIDGIEGVTGRIELWDLGFGQGSSMLNDKRQGMFYFKTDQGQSPTMRSGLAFFDGKRFQLIALDGEQMPNDLGVITDVRALKIDAQGRCYVGLTYTANHPRTPSEKRIYGVFCFENGTLTPILQTYQAITSHPDLRTGILLQHESLRINAKGQLLVSTPLESSRGSKLYDAYILADKHGSTLLASRRTSLKAVDGDIALGILGNEPSLNDHGRFVFLSGISKPTMPYQNRIIVYDGKAMRTVAASYNMLGMATWFGLIESVRMNNAGQLFIHEHLERPALNSKQRLYRIDPDDSRHEIFKYGVPGAFEGFKESLWPVNIVVFSDNGHCVSVAALQPPRRPKNGEPRTIPRLGMIWHDGQTARALFMPDSKLMEGSEDRVYSVNGPVECPDQPGSYLVFMSVYRTSPEGKEIKRDIVVRWNPTHTTIISPPIEYSRPPQGVFSPLPNDHFAQVTTATGLTVYINSEAMLFWEPTEPGAAAKK